LAACEACRRAAACDVTLKWPNDLIFRGRKLGGILAELRSAGLSTDRLIVGLGLNVLHGDEDFPAALRGEATSLRLACGGGSPHREELAAVYLHRFGELATALRSGDWVGISQKWESFSPGCRGGAVRVLSRAAFEGITDGLDFNGGLRIRKSDGTIGVVHTAETVVPKEG
jgi:BirA family biotin operon repressor/biotin-[acetyl-CoA-carboxylase] ligase